MFAKKFLIFLCYVLILTGCGTIMNPYDKEFSCPQWEKGKCVGIMEAYQESLNQTKGNYTLSLEEKKILSPEILLLNPAEERYVVSLYNKLERLLKDPQTPVIAPPKVVRILILPYSSPDGKHLYSARYSFVVVDEPRWILQNILTSPTPEE